MARPRRPASEAINQHINQVAGNDTEILTSMIQSDKKTAFMPVYQVLVLA